MACLGGIPFAGASAALDSAAAFQLVRTPRRAACVRVDGAEVEVRPDTGYVVSRFTAADSAESAHQRGLALVQAGLDLLSITGEDDLATKKAFEECLVAWRAPAGQVIQIRSQTTLSVAVGAVTIRNGDAVGRIVTDDPAPPVHHPGFRYFRLAQTTDDPAEAFRNIYLSIECLLSSRVAPTRHEKERDWLERALRSADADLNLRRFFAAPPDDPVVAFIATVYTATRLPLFHAKADRSSLAAHESEEDRRAVLSALELATAVVLALSEQWYGARRRGGLVFSGPVYRSLREMFGSARILAMPDTEPVDRTQRDLSSARYRAAVAFRTEVRDHASDARRPALFGELAAANLWAGTLTKIEVVGPDFPLSVHTLESPLSLNDFATLQYYDVAAVDNARQPKARFSH
jgi:hypothetical protein